MRVAIYHTDEDTVLNMKHIIDQFQEESGIQIQMEQFSDIGELLSSISHNRMFQIYLLQAATIEQNLNMDSLRNRIAQIDQDALFIEILTSGIRPVESFHVCHLFQPLDSQLTIHVLKEASEYLLYKKSYFCLDNRQEILTVKTSQIKYFQSYNRKITVYLLSGQYEYYGRLKEVSQQVDTRFFIQINKSNIINMFYITWTDFKTIQLRTGESLPLSKKYRDEFREEYRLFIGRGKGEI